MISKEAIATQQLSPVVETIFHWQADDPSHCLLRIFVDGQTQQAYVVASELYSNKTMEKHVLHDFEELALDIFTRHSTLLDPDNINGVSWISHYGRFSVVVSFENLTKPEEFRKVDLPWPLPEQLSRYDGKDTYLEEPDEQKLFSQILLEPVANILDRISGDL
ncbi:hypothetical protein [Acaryochloris sp. IP29b_bin.148]|uniref:hypothetical protein n=1 Tax=Acaryochloris sp. IP29b_bin.148 TaxID=2969218 RepID=UPI002612AB73|nr:hypothetical protein [Acaryochloris sp. IP29b_bin.148]